MKTKLWAVACLFSSSLAVAGGSVGNGGDVLVDASGHVQLVDFYEAETLRGMKIDFGAVSIAPQDKVAAVLTQLQNLSPARYALYKSRLDSFFNEALLLPNAQLETIDDVQLVAIPTGSTMQQIAVQKEPEFPEDKVYTINKDLWDKLDNDGKAGLILHEIVYRETKAWESNSITARYFATSLASHKFAAMGLPDFVTFLESVVHFHSIDIAGLVFDLTGSDPRCPAALVLNPNGTPLCGFVTSGKAKLANSAGGMITIHGFTYFDGNGTVVTTTVSDDTEFTVGQNDLAVPGGASIAYYTYYKDGLILQNGIIQSATIPGSFGIISVIGPNLNLSFSPPSCATTLQFYESGTLQSLWTGACNDGVGTLKIGKQTLSVAGPWLQFTPGGVLTVGSFEPGSQFTTGAGVITIGSFPGVVTFDTSGVIQSCQLCTGDFSVAGQSIKMSSSDFSITIPLALYPSGVPESGVLVSDLTIQGTRVDTGSYTRTELNDKGIVVTTAVIAPVSLKVGSTLVSFLGAITLYDDGNTVKSGTLAQDIDLPLAVGGTKHFLTSMTVNFDPNGLVK